MKNLVPEATKDLRKNLLIVTKIRYAAIFAAAAVGLWAHSFGLFPAISMVYAVIVAGVAENVWLHVRYRRWKEPVRTLFFNVILDNVLITLAVYISGGPRSPFLILYLGTALNFAFFVNPLLSASGFLLSLGCFGGMLLLEALGILPVIPLSPELWSQDVYGRVWMIALVMYLAMTITVGWVLAMIYRKAREEVRDRTETLLSLHHSLKAIVTSHDLNQVLVRVTRAASGLTGMEFCNVFLLDETGLNVKGTATNVDEVRHGLGSIKDLIIPIRGTKVEECLRNNAPLVISHAEKTVSEGFREVLTRLNIASVLLVPLSLGGESKGILVLTSPGRDVEFPATVIASAMGIAQQASVAIENARLFVEQKDALEISSAMVRVSEELARIVDMDEMKKAVSRLSKELVGSDRTGLWHYDGRGNVFTFGESEGLSGEEKEYLHKVILSASDLPFVRPEMRGKGSKIIEDAKNSPLLPRALVEKFSVGSIMITPLYGREGLMGGMIYIFSPSPSSFTPKVKAIAERIAPIVAGGLERVKAFRAKEEKAAQVEAALRSSEGINLLVTEKEMVETVMRNMQTIVPFQHGIVRLWDEDEGVLKVIYGKGYPEEEVNRCILPGEGMSGISFRQMESILVRDFSVETQYSPELPGGRSALVLPLIAFGRAWGVIHMCSHQADYFSRDIQSVIHLFSNQLAIGIRNFRLYAQSRYLRNYLENLIQRANAMIIVTNGDGSIMTFNRRAEQITGYTQSEVEGKIAGNLFIDKNDGKARRALAQAMTRISAGDSIDNFESVLVTKTGERRHGIYSLSPIYGKNGKVSEIIVVGQDFTQVKIMEGQMKQAEKMAILGQLSAGIAHELNNPLTVLSSHAYLMKMKAAVDGRKDDEDKAETILKATERIQKLSGGLLDFARPKEEAKRAVNITEIVDQALFFSDYLLKKKMIAVERSADPATPPIFGIRDNLLQVILNLLSNSCDAIGEGKEGRICVTTRPFDMHYVMIEVKDNGEGIREEHLDRIFEPFYTTKSNGRGVGLGLSIVMKIVTAHEGRVTMKSSAGEGTTVTILLPAWQGSDQAVTGAPAKDAGGG